LFAHGEGEGSIAISVDDTRLGVRVGGDTQELRGGQLKPGAWHHIAVTMKERATLYVDGREVASGAVALGAIDADLIIGAGLRGSLDEVQVAAAVRSADWIGLAATSQGPDSKLLSFAEQAQASNGSSYFTILLGAVTIDGWIVIAILLVMMLVSFWIMLSKGLDISRIARANEEFRSRFSTNAGAVDALAADTATVAGAQSPLASSSLFEVYQVAMTELKRRGVDAAGAPPLSASALTAIKASVDAGVVRSNERLNRSMVLLTIAISGGPFLGLLGTVVGVMITFAAIAAVGDVNVNSIAPGIAAALVATVAGLGVAIPALFGYNYLASRIKSISNDMAVFSDEVVSRIAERYSA
jgi:biopolymer transport protein ExbB